MIYHSVLEVARSGINDILIVINRRKKSLCEYLEQGGLLEDLKKAPDVLIPLPHITLIDQPAPLGSGEAIYRAKDMIGDQPFALMMPDYIHLGSLPALSQMISVYEQFRHDTVGIVTLNSESAKGFGNVGMAETKDLGQGAVVVLSFSKKSKDPLLVEEGRAIQKLVGRWILGPHFFSYLERVREDKDWDDATALQALSREKKIIGKIPEGTGFDVGNPIGYRHAVVFLRENAAIRSRGIEFSNKEVQRH